MRPGGSTICRIAFIVTLLPHPLSPTMPTTWPGADVERHAVHRAHQALVEEEVHAQITHLQDGRHQEP